MVIDSLIKNKVNKTLLVILLLIIGCSTPLKTDYESLVLRENRYYKEFSTELFTGHVYNIDGLEENIGFIKNGLFEGEYILFYPNGNVKEKSFFKYGWPEGEEILYHEYGKLKEINNWKNGRYHGPQIEYDDFGLGKIDVIHKKNDEYHGYWIRYYTTTSGNAVNKSTGEKYIRGLNIKSMTYYENDIKKFKIDFYANRHDDSDWINKKEPYGKYGPMKQYITHISGYSGLNGNLGFWKQSTEYYYPSEAEDKIFYYKTPNGDSFIHGQIKEIHNYQAKKDPQYTGDTESHGPRIKYYPNGQIEQYWNFVNGKKEGRWVNYHPNGQIESERNYVDDTLEGSYINYHPNGQIELESFFLNGKTNPNRTTTRYDENGEIAAEGVFKNDKYWNGTFFRWVVDPSGKKIHSFTDDLYIVKIVTYKNGISINEKKIKHWSTD